MSKIINISRAVEISKKLKEQNKTIVLVGGCFDILHIGHIEFLKQAKRKEDFLFVLLESDEAIRKLKGVNRPINTQEDRARVLSALEAVDYIIAIPLFETSKKYDDLIKKIKPDTIAMTEGDPYKRHKERQARLIQARAINVIRKISNKSTTSLIKLLAENS